MALTEQTLQEIFNKGVQSYEENWSAFQVKARAEAYNDTNGPKAKREFLLGRQSAIEDADD